MGFLPLWCSFHRATHQTTCALQRLAHPKNSKLAAVCHLEVPNLQHRDTSDQDRGLENSNFDSHLGRKHELRKPPPLVAFKTRPSLWAICDDNGIDEEFKPSNTSKKQEQRCIPVSLAKHSRNEGYSLSLRQTISTSLPHTIAVAGGFAPHVCCRMAEIDKRL